MKIFLIISCIVMAFFAMRSQLNMDPKNWTFGNYLIMVTATVLLLISIYIIKNFEEIPNW